MLKKTYPSAFFARPTLTVARQLLGTRLCRRLPDGTVLTASIIETEAYTQDDPASHAFRGQTPRSAIMFGPPGYAYVYFIYGMYNCLNVVTEPKSTAGAVLIRALDSQPTSGPGKLCRHWAISGADNGADLMNPASGLWLEPGPPLTDEQVLATPRIGISVATDYPWRFIVKDHPHISRPSRSTKPRQAGRTK